MTTLLFSNSRPNLMTELDLARVIVDSITVDGQVSDRVMQVWRGVDK